MYPRQDLLDVPAPEVRMQPDVVPPPESLRRVGMIAAELLRQVRALEGRLRLGDAPHADVLDENMGRHDHQPLDAVAHRRVDERDRSAVGMAHENRTLDAEPLEQLRQDFEGFDVHVVDRARPAKNFGLTVAVARVDHRGAAGCRGRLLREIAPHRDRAQAFVEKHERGRSGAGDSEDFELAALDGNEGRFLSCGQCVILHGISGHDSIRSLRILRVSGASNTRSARGSRARPPSPPASRAPRLPSRRCRCSRARRAPGPP